MDIDKLQQVENMRAKDASKNLESKKSLSKKKRKAKLYIQKVYKILEALLKDVRSRIILRELIHYILSLI